MTWKWLTQSGHIKETNQLVDPILKHALLHAYAKCDPQQAYFRLVDIRTVENWILSYILHFYWLVLIVKICFLEPRFFFMFVR